MTEPTISDLVNVYNVLSNALSVIRNAHDQALMNSEADPAAKIADGQVRLLEEEETELEDRLKSIILRIKEAPVRSTQDAIEKMRFELLAYGSSQISEEVAEEIRDAYENQAAAEQGRKRIIH